MTACPCGERHRRRRIVLTGGPGAGKTATLELVRQALCDHVRILPESAGILFTRGFPRHGVAAVRQAVQRAIFFTQRELEAVGQQLMVAWGRPLPEWPSRNGTGYTALTVRRRCSAS
jgi:hypothetical protein